MLRSPLVVLFSFSLMLSIVTPLVFEIITFESAPVGIQDICDKDSPNQAAFELEEDGKTIQSLPVVSGMHFDAISRIFHFALRGFQTQPPSILCPPPDFHL
jgi:hypothetical protein